MMDFYVAYYPMIIAALQLIILFASYKLWRAKRFKTAFALIVISAAIFFFAPVKIDGTKTKQYHKHSVAERVSEYMEISKNSKVIQTKKPTFDEVLREEERRSDNENKKIEEELVGGRSH